jgi:beta-N-acetylhexosaminidase
MPGHGRATADSHFALPVVNASREELALDLAPFRALARRAPMGMTAHILFKAWDAKRPATLSPAVIADTIRGEIGFDGLLMSDDIAMKALSGPLAARAGAALAAGVDIVLHCSGKARHNETLANALPPIGETAAARLARAMLATGTAATGDLAALTAKRDALLALA